MNDGIAIDFRRRGLQDPNFQTLGETKHIDRPRYARLGRLDGVELVKGQAGQARL